MLPASQSLVFDIYSLLTSNRQKPTVIVVGYGWAGSSFVNNIDIKKYQIKVISKTKTRFNQPYIIADLEPSFTEPPSRMEIIEDEAVSINEIDRCLKSAKEDYYYDYLVIATGSEVNDFGVKGVKENCLMFKTELDLQRLKNSIVDKKEITVIGAGPTGIELAFKLSSLGKTVTVIEAGKEILPGFSDKMRSEISKHLNKSNILVKTSTQIKEVLKDGYITNVERVKDLSLKIWTCGIKPSSFARNFMNPLKPDGQLMIKPRIYAIGDSIVGHGPPTAQNASSQGLYLAAIFNSEFKNLSTYKYLEKGRVIDATTCLIIEYKGNVITLPSLFRTIYESFTR